MMSRRDEDRRKNRKRKERRSERSRSPVEGKHQPIDRKQTTEHDNMTPAEKLRAKLKVMLDQTATPTITPTNDVAVKPTPAEIIELEIDDFTPQNFTSKRTERFNKDEPAASSLTGHENAIFGTNSERNMTEKIEITKQAAGEFIESNDSTCDTNGEDRALKWAQKLKSLRDKYLSMQ